MPLAIATGAGAASKVSVGITVFGGMLAATILTTLAVPAFYVLVQGLAERISGKAPSPPGSSEPPPRPPEARLVVPGSHS